MQVRSKIKLLLLFVITIFIAVTVYLQQSITKETEALLHEKLIETKEKEAPRLLELNASYMKSYNYDYSVWDQAVDFVTGKKPISWGDEELKGSLSNYKIDYIWVVDAAGKKVYTTTTRANLVQKQLEIPNEDFVADLSKTKSKSFFINHNNALTEVFVGGITPTSDKNRNLNPVGYLIFGRIVDSVYMSNLKSLSPEITFAVTEKTEVESISTKTGELNYSIPIKNFGGKNIASFSVSRSYPVLSKYQLFLNRYLISFTVFIVILGFLFYLSSQKMLLKPLYALWTSLKNNNVQKLQTYIGKKDEFGQLSTLMSNFFSQKRELELEIETRKKSEEELVQALIEKKSEQTERVKTQDFLEQQQAILQLNIQNSDLHFKDKLKEIIALAAKTIKCERVGIWRYHDRKSSINAVVHYTLSKNEFANGMIAYEQDYPTYFQHLKKEVLIVANDARNNPITKEFLNDYLIPEGITSMIDVPIRSGKKVIGVICCEHVGPQREWTLSEQVFMQSIADIITLNYEQEERRKAEEQLVKDQIRFEETQELAHIGTWEFDFFTQNVLWSKEMFKIFDLENTPSEKLFEAYREKLHKDDLKTFDQAILDLMEKQVAYTVESRIICKNGDVKNILAIGEVIKSKHQQKIIGLRGTVQDITKQKQAALAKSDFLSCMSHEIRTPINGVIGIANLLQDEELNERQQEYVKTLNFSAQHLSTVVSDILDFSKIESGHMTFEKVSFNLEKNCRYVFDLFANKAAEKNLTYKFIPSPVKEFSLYGDYVRLNQVLSNLLSNAIKFTETGGVTFGYNAIEDDTDKIAVIFSIKDTGIGISKSQEKNIFESFTQASENITRQYGGTGLGLTISKKLVELQHGKISVNSKEGEGSEFIVQLSFDKHVYVKKPLNALTTADKDQMKKLPGMKILIAEDNKTNAMVLSRFLGKWDIESQIAKNGQEVLDILEMNSFDMILMDIQMPLMDGIEATSRIRKMEDTETKNIPIVAFTADASIDTHRSLLKNGFNHCVTKPFSPEQLFNFLRKNHFNNVETLTV